MLRFADDNFHDRSVLAKIFVTSESLQQVRLWDTRAQSNNVYKIFLHDTQSSQVLAVLAFDFALLGFLVALLGLLFSVPLDVRLELCNPRGDVLTPATYLKYQTIFG